MIYSPTTTNSNPKIFSLVQSHLTRLASTIFKWLVLLPSYKLYYILCCKQCDKSAIIITVDAFVVSEQTLYCLIFSCNILRLFLFVKICNKFDEYK